MSFKGKKVLVTGGGRGIGLAIVQEFYSEEATVYIIDKDPNLLKNVKKELPNVEIIELDLLNWDKTKEVIETLGPFDHLVNNAGIAFDDTIFETTEKSFDLTMGVNFKAAVNCSIAFANFAKLESGSKKQRTIVNITSIGDKCYSPNFSIYCSSKIALKMMSRHMAVEFAPYGIRVNCIGPGMIWTELSKGFKKETIKNLEVNVPQKELCGELSAKDIAKAVLYYSSPQSQKITGQAVYVDSGITAF